MLRQAAALPAYSENLFTDCAWGLGKLVNILNVLTLNTNLSCLHTELSMQRSCIEVMFACVGVKWPCRGYSSLENDALLSL